MAVRVYSTPCMADMLGPQQPRPDWAFNENNYLKEMDTIPLFMQNLPAEHKDNTALQALQALVYDGTPEDIAENFKEQGNAAFKSGLAGLQDALQYYTDALGQNSTNQDLNATCYLNRAAVNLKLKNYRRVLNDCSKALSLNSNLIKAHYRSAKALYALERLDEALECIHRGLKIDPDDDSLKNEREKCLKKQAEIDLKCRERIHANQYLYF